MNVAIQGAQASFHHQAAASWFGEAISIIECESFGDVFGALNRHEAMQADGRRFDGTEIEEDAFGAERPQEGDAVATIGQGVEYPM